MRSAWKPGSNVYVSLSDAFNRDTKGQTMLALLDWDDINGVNYIRLDDPDRPILTRPEIGSGRLTVRYGTDAELYDPKTGIYSEAITFNLNSPHWLKESTIALSEHYVDMHPEKVSSLVRYEESHNNFFADCYHCMAGTFFDVHTSTRNSYGIPFNTTRFAYLIYQVVFHEFPWYAGGPN